MSSYHLEIKLVDPRFAIVVQDCQELRTRACPIVAIIRFSSKPPRAIAEAASNGRSIDREDTFIMSSFTPAEVLQELLNGNERFITGLSAHPHQDFARLQSIQDNQTPMCAVLGCADSRVPAEIVFDQGFGDMFTCRIAGNLATSEEIASLECAVISLECEMFRRSCGPPCDGPDALATPTLDLAPGPPKRHPNKQIARFRTDDDGHSRKMSSKAFPGFINTLVDHLDMAIVRAQTREAKTYEELRMMQDALKSCKGNPDPEVVEMVIRENVLLQMERIMRSTIIGKAVREGKVKVAGAVYSLDTGKVTLMKP
eukprot:gene17809-24187_t